MGFLNAALLVSAIFAASSAFAARLVPFADQNGCKLFATDSIVKRLHEMAAVGTVTWDGQCKGGLIEGKGVLREEGSLAEGNKTRKFAYFFSGAAHKGLREGVWQRETFERFVDSPRFYTSAAVVEFTHGVVTGKLRLLTITKLDQLSPAFRRYVIEAQRDAKPANEALAYTPAASAPRSEPPRPATGPVPTAPRVPEQATGAPVVKRVPQRGSAPRVTASSQQQLGPEGLLASVAPGWQSQSPPDYPEWIIVDFQASREIASLGLLPEEDHVDRAPKVIRLEFSDDAKKWTPMPAAERPCALDPKSNWSILKLPAVRKSRYVKIYILDNCGDPAMVTIRGLRFE